MKATTHGGKRKRVIGAPPSSNACRTCRARRVKCDETFPRCRRCEEAGRCCQGFRTWTVNLTDAAASASPGIPIKTVERRATQPATDIVPFESQLALTAINSTPVFRAQALSNFLQAHKPPGTLGEQRGHSLFSWIQKLPTVDTSSRLVAKAVDSLCLAYFGNANHDSRLVQSSQRHFGEVLTALIAEVSCPSAKKEYKPRDILTSIMLVGLFDDATPADLRRRKPWMTHMQGALQYLEATGPETLDFHKLYDTRLFQNLRMPALMFSIARRKRLLFSQSKWQLLSGTHSPGVIEWYPLISQFPALLEDADAVLLRKMPNWTPAHANILERLDNYGRRLLAWLQREMVDGSNPASLAGVSTREPFERQVLDGPLVMIACHHADVFDPDIEEHVFMCTSDTFPAAFRMHKNVSQALRCTISWLVCLLLDCTMMRLISGAVSDHDSDSRIPKYRITERHALTMAENLCRSVHAVSDLGSIAFADYILVILEAARAFFEDYGAEEQAQWCRDCVFANRVRAARLRATGPLTLCRVLDLSEDIASAVRYKPVMQSREVVGSPWTVLETQSETSGTPPSFHEMSASPAYPASV